MIDIKWSESQQQAIDEISQGINIFIHSPAGNGKSFIIKSLCKLFPTKPIAITSSTGISAFGIGGLTIHSFLGLGIGNYTASQSCSKISRERKEFIKNELKILIIDEISMISMELFSKINLVLQKITGKYIRFGGIQTICSGDLFQLSPITGTPIYESDLFKEFKHVELTSNFRQENEDEFLELLNRMRLGNSTENDLNILNDKVVENYTNSEEFTLFATNAKVNSMNKKKYLELKQKEYVFKAVFTGNKEILEDIKKQFITKDTLELKLKQGCNVMLIRNIDTSIGLVNGARGIITKINNNQVYVKFNENEVLVPYCVWDVRLGKEKASATQLPLVLSYSSTINKAQGMTLDKAVMDLGSCFNNHMVYTCLSRVKSLNGLTLLSFNPAKITVDKKIFDFFK